MGFHILVRKKSIKSLKESNRYTQDFTLYPGHGITTTLKQEQKRMPMWIDYIEYLSGK